MTLTTDVSKATTRLTIREVEADGREALLGDLEGGGGLGLDAAGDELAVLLPNHTSEVHEVAGDDDVGEDGRAAGLLDDLPAGLGHCLCCVWVWLRK